MGDSAQGYLGTAVGGGVGRRLRPRATAEFLLDESNGGGCPRLPCGLWVLLQVGTGKRVAGSRGGVGTAPVRGLRL
jgi:hypothetical protein